MKSVSFANPASSIKSNSTTGILQITGPAAGSTRVMTVPDANFTSARTDAAQSFTGDQTLATGNLIQGTAAKGLNFTANTPAAGMTSQLLNWYEEGTFTPSITSGATGITYGTQNGHYTRIGRQVFFRGQISTTVGTPDANQLIIGGLPFTSNGSVPGGAYFSYDNGSLVGSTTVNLPLLFVDANSTQITMWKTDGGGFTGTNAVSVAAMNFYFIGQYFV